jgi:formylglycine-generating enzyme
MYTGGRMARAFRRALGRLLHRTVPAGVVRGFGGALVAVGVALPWVALGPEGRAPVVEDHGDEPTPPTPIDAPADANPRAGEPASGTRVAEATALRPALVHVVGGVFMMGSPPGEAGRDDEDEAQHRVQVHGFDMCETEVTQAQYVAVRNTLPRGCGASCGDTLPAHSVSWYDAVHYLDALSVREGLSPCYGGKDGEDVSWDRSCTGYRLPTEAEWEFAARAGTTTAYSFGDAPADLCKHANGESQGCDDGFAGLAPVGSFRAAKGNAWNLLDMHGNVWEWVWDAYDANFGLSVKQGAVNGETVAGRPRLTDVNQLTDDPSGPPIGGDRVLRGGSFGFEPGNLRSACRSRYEPSVRLRNIGFRCIRASRPQP